MWVISFVANATSDFYLAELPTVKTVGYLQMSLTGQSGFSRRKTLHGVAEWGLNESRATIIHGLTPVANNTRP